MKILITDDNAVRYRRLIAEMEAIGVSRDSVDFAPSANDSRDRMERTQYDLMILDILLPLRPEDDELAVQNSLDLLVEVHESDELKKPRHILGITADPSVAGEAGSAFAAHTWAVVEYSEVSDEWIGSVMNCVRYLQGIGAQQSTERRESVDLVILCALQAPELEEVLRLPWNWAPPRPIDDQTFVHDGRFDSAGRTFSVCAAFAPRMGMVASALRANSLINALRPKMLGMTGICAGVRGKVELGDVLLVDPSWDFQSGKRVGSAASSSFAMAPHQLYASPIVRAHIEQLRSDQGALSKIAMEFAGDAPRAPKLVIGPVASGSAVLADGSVIEEIKAQHRELVGVEMEAYGLYAAVQAAPEPKPLVFALKSVCDYADSSKGDDFQRYAAHTSAQAMRLLMERHGARLLGGRR